MATTPPEILAADTLADQTYRAVRTAIATGKLVPGQRVTERGLAEELSVSPTPVREAVRRLQQDGLLERTGPRTVKVSFISETAIRDLAEVEIALRGMIARFAAERATDDQLDQLDAILDDADDLLILIRQRREQGTPHDRHLHQLLDTMQRFNEAVEDCVGNPVLLRLLEQARVFSPSGRRARLLELLATNDEFGLDRYQNHRRLVRALRDRDPAAAERIATERARAGLSDMLESAAPEPG
ncbi:GntR family transcriptional regulator [Nocardioides sp. SYSU D00038]|uniref:GntR family transcriptional regulator n=1 Tax=Nocardioides sp. SYSU D00038 TaxID=2812554 RepID=UPI001967FD89|nr:GntR family transcriptional regulator [Nocardioides sp. SYSU D00038]